MITLARCLFLVGSLCGFLSQSLAQTEAPTQIVHWDGVQTTDRKIFKDGGTPVGPSPEYVREKAPYLTGYHVLADGGFYDTSFRAGTQTNIQKRTVITTNITRRILPPQIDLISKRVHHLPNLYLGRQQVKSRTVGEFIKDRIQYRIDHGLSPNYKHARHATLKEVKWCVNEGNCGQKYLWTHGEKIKKTSVDFGSINPSSKPNETHIFNGGNKTVTIIYGDEQYITITELQYKRDRDIWLASAECKKKHCKTTDFKWERQTHRKKTKTKYLVTEREKVVETKEEREEVVQTEERRKGKWEFDIAPFIFFDFLLSDEAEVADLQGESPRQSLVFTESNETLYKVTKTEGFDLGVGVSATGQYSGGGLLGALVPFAAVAPTYGRTKVTTRYVVGNKAKDEVESYDLPKNVEDFEDWQVGDNLSLNIRTGYMAVGGLNFYIVGVGYFTMQHSADESVVMSKKEALKRINSNAHWDFGKWKVDYTKLPNNVIRVQASQASSGIHGPNLLLGLLNISRAKAHEIGFNFAFDFDLNNQEGKQALNDLLTSEEKDIARLERLAEEAGRGVQKVNEEVSETHSLITSLTLGLPWLGGVSWAKGDVYPVKYIDSTAKGHHEDVNHGIYVNTETGKLLGDVKFHRTKGFYGTTRDYIKNKKFQANQSNYYGQFGYMVSQKSYLANTVTSKSLNNEINNLVKMTYLKNALKLKVPAGRDLGFVKLQFLMTIDKFAVQRLIQKAQDDPKIFERAAMEFYKDYFRSDLARAKNIWFPENHPDENYIQDNELQLCHLADQTTRNATLKKCLARYQREILEATKEMPKLLKAMGRHLIAKSNTRSRKDRNIEAGKFTKKFGEFGKHMLVNMFTFQSIFRVLGGEGMSANYQITGEKLANHRIDMVFTKAK